MSREITLYSGMQASLKKKTADKKKQKTGTLTISAYSW